MDAWREWSAEELDLQYSPSAWVKRLPQPQVVPNHMDLLVKGLEQIRQDPNFTIESNVQYSNAGSDTFLDLISPKNCDLSQPLFIYFHGGYWQALTKDHGAALASSCGTAVATIGYDLCPIVSLSTIVDQARLAVAFLHQNYPGRPLVLCGHSAGAHLAAMVLSTPDWHQYKSTTAPKFKGACLISGVYDLRPIRVTEAVNQGNCLHIASDEEAVALSPQLLLEKPSMLKQCLANNAKIVVVAGELDSPEFRRQTNDFGNLLLNLLRDTSCRVSVEILSERDHFDIVERAIDPADQLAQMIRSIIS